MYRTSYTCIERPIYVIIYRTSCIGRHIHVPIHYSLLILFFLKRSIRGNEQLHVQDILYIYRTIVQLDIYNKYWILNNCRPCIRRFNQKKSIRGNEQLHVQDVLYLYRMSYTCIGSPIHVYDVLYMQLLITPN